MQDVCTKVQCSGNDQIFLNILIKSWSEELPNPIHAINIVIFLEY